MFLPPFLPSRFYIRLATVVADSQPFRANIGLCRFYVQFVVGEMARAEEEEGKLLFCASSWGLTKLRFNKKKCCLMAAMERKLLGMHG